MLCRLPDTIVETEEALISSTSISLPSISILYSTLNLMVSPTASRLSNLNSISS